MAKRNKVPKTTTKKKIYWSSGIEITDNPADGNIAGQNNEDETAALANTSSAAAMEIDENVADENKPVEVPVFYKDIPLPDKVFDTVMIQISKLSEVQERNDILSKTLATMMEVVPYVVTNGDSIAFFDCAVRCIQVRY